MIINRVQKLLFSEYCDFEDMVLVESPFAQTTKDGKGIRQVYLGLTPTKLVLATDVIPPVQRSGTRFNSGIDPEIETFELIAIYPVECVNLTIFSKQKRQALKAHFCNNKVLYFELGGFEKREMFWNLWQERLRFLNPDEMGSSKSQTSVASSSTTSTLYLVDTKKVVKANGLKQLWCKFGTGNSQSNPPTSWTDKYLYMGKILDDRSHRYVPKMNKPTLKEFVRHAKLTRNKTSPCNSDVLPNSSYSQISNSVNRFGYGIEENCSHSLILPSKGDNSAQFSEEGFIVMAEICIELWESSQAVRKIVHKRRYGLCPHPHFLHGLGPWNIPPGCKYSVQVKRAVSMVTITRQPQENSLRLPISRRQLLTTISYDNLNADRLIDRWSGSNLSVILFWTPCYWYRPRSAKFAYDELQDHISSIKEWQESKHSKRKALKRMFHKKQTRKESGVDHDIDIDPSNIMQIKEKHVYFDKYKCGLKNIVDSSRNKQETLLQSLKKSLRMTVILSAWDFDSSTLAQQLTLIDKEFLIRITSIELGTIIWQQSSKNTPNISAIIAFSHRISCLVATEILKEESEKIRARLIARFINVANKCHRMSNYQSCKSVLCGMQCLPVFRLRATWAYVRKKHPTSHQVFEYLCRLYKDVRLATYQKSFHKAMKTPPYLPQIADILAKLLERVPEYKFGPVQTDIKMLQPHHLLEPMSKNYNSTLTNIFLSVKNILHWNSNHLDGSKTCECSGIPFKTLHNYFMPLEFYEDTKIRRLQEITRFLANSQFAAATYSFDKNELAKSYLLKARYKEDKENFRISLNLEPPIPNNKYSNKN